MNIYPPAPSADRIRSSLSSIDDIGFGGDHLPISSRRMFGAIGLYRDAVFFAIISGDVLYFKVGDANRNDFDSRGMPRFKPFSEMPLEKACAPAHQARMKTIGLLGGMSWESTIPYYRQINEFIKERLGGLHSARIILHSVDFHEVELLMRVEDWHGVGRILSPAARSLEVAGADCLVLCTNTMHKVAETIEAAIRIPLLHIADPTAAVIRAAGHNAVGLLGTRFTMEDSFYRDRLTTRHGLTVLTPSAADRDSIHRIIFEELCLGKVVPESRDTYRRIIGSLAACGAQAVILGCTEISLLITQNHTQVPLFDTTAIHALHAAAWSLGPR